MDNSTADQIRRELQRVSDHLARVEELAESDPDTDTGFEVASAASRVDLRPIYKALGR